MRHLAKSYRLRIERKKQRFRARRKSRQLQCVATRTNAIAPTDILVFMTVRDELIRLPYFLKYYRDQGVNHFLIVDNNSTDGTREYLAGQGDVSLWTTAAGYRQARYGMDWLNWLLRKYGHGHWCLTVDPDEFLVYPFCDTRPLRALTDWLDASSTRSFSAMLLDIYPHGAVGAQRYVAGQNPLELTPWFDAGNYTYRLDPRYWNLWIQGGVRSRMFFADTPEKAPALNKIPLVKWHRRYVYLNSTHMLLPRGLNLVYDDMGGEKTSGALLHAKFLHTFRDKITDADTRAQHYAGGRQYDDYDPDTVLWCAHSQRYINWRQLEVLGLISKGNWV